MRPERHLVAPPEPNASVGMERRLRVAAALIDADDLTVEDVTKAGRSQLGLPTAAIVGRSILDLIDPAEREHARAAFDAIRSGAIDFYRGERRRLTPTSGPGSVWARRLLLDGRAVILAAWFGGENGGRGPVESADGRLFGLAVAAGIADRHGRVRAVSVDDAMESQLRPEMLIGRRVCTPDQEREIVALQRSQPALVAQSFAYPMPWEPPAGYRGQLTCVVTALAGSDDLLFLLIGLPAASSEREAELEARLWRIAAEVDASGILQRVGRAQARGLHGKGIAAALSPRQWDILRRLVEGQRVSTIASQLYLSPSTVRGHLSAIFDRFGVHGQAELLRVLASDDAETSALSG